MANKTVLRLHMNDCYKCKRVALHSVTKIEGIDSLTIDMKENTLTVIGDADPVCMSNLLRKKFRCAQLLSVGPVSQGGGGGGKGGGAEGGKGGESGKAKGGDKGGGGEEGKAKGGDKGGGGDKAGGGGGKEGKVEPKAKAGGEGKGEGGGGGGDKGKGKGSEAGKGEGAAKGGTGGGVTVVNPQYYLPFSGCSCGPRCHHVCDAQCYPPHSACPCRRVCYQVCQGHCCPPCSYCSCRPEIPWAQYPQPCANPNEVWYVWNEVEKEDSCTIM